MEKEEFFVSECIFPARSLTAGKKYEVINESQDYIEIINDNGRQSGLLRSRFGEIELETRDKIMKKSIKCINAGNFKGITKGKTYKIDRATQSYLYVHNNSGRIARYGKKYFDKVDDTTRPAKPVKKREVAVGKFGVDGEILFGKEYDYKPDPRNSDHILVKNEKGSEQSYLKSRFKFNTV